MTTLMSLAGCVLLFVTTPSMTSTVVESDTVVCPFAGSVTVTCSARSPEMVTSSPETAPGALTTL